MFDDKVCANCGEKLKKGGAFKWVFIFILLIILAVGGAVAAVMYVPDRVPPVITDNVKKVGAILKNFGVPVPPALLPAPPAEEQAPAAEPAPAVETPAAPTTETPEAAPDKMNIELPKVPDVVIQEPGGATPAPAPAEPIVE
jgi:flagellar basal body-associated protein FliL